MPVPAKEDFQAKRQQLLQQGGFDPSLALDDTYIQDANTLYQTLATLLTGLDTEQQIADTAYARSTGDLNRQKVTDFDRLRQQMAFRGLLGSTAHEGKESELTNQYLKSFNDLATTKGQTDRGITERRTAAEGDYTTGLGNESLDLTDAAKRYLAKQTQTEADLGVASHQGDANAAVSGVGTDIGGQIAAAIAKYNQPPDFSQFANMFIQNMPKAAAPAPVAPKAPVIDPRVADPLGIRTTSSMNPPKYSLGGGGGTKVHRR